MFKRFRLLVLVITPLTLVVGMVLAAIITYLMPKLYETFAVIEIKRLPHEYKLLEESPTLAAEAYRANVAAAHQRLNNSAFLDKVSQNLDLPNRWDVDAQTSTRRLGEIIRVEQIDGTDLIRIRVRHTNREDAMDIISALLDVFTSEQEEKWEQTDEQKQLLEIRVQVEEQEEVVEKLRRQMSGIPDHITDSALPETSTTQERFRLETERLQELKIKLLPELLIPTIPYESIIIHDEPIIPDSPSFPDIRFNLILGAVAGLLAGPHLAIAIMWVRRPVAAGL